jgi:hypothetical protein
MDGSQTDHLKAYGITFWALEHDIDVEWLLNYRGGSFLLDNYAEVIRELRLRDVKFETGPAGSEMNIYAEIEANNMDVVLLEKAPKIAVYSPPGKQPWDDAVTLALTYAEVDYEIIWDSEVLDGKLNEYDWLHLHHEDFTGQYGKFYRSYSNATWYREQKSAFETFAASRGFASVSQLKKMVASRIRDYVLNGGFVFAMCSATDALDIALAAQGIDIVARQFDGDGVDPDAQKKLNFKRTLAFENFTIIPDPMTYEYSDIDIPPSNQPQARGAEEMGSCSYHVNAKSCRGSQRIYGPNHRI